jgi:extradiol dioxygenase family protein
VIQSFHLSFVVPDKGVAKDFYLNALGCTLGRDNEAWFDVLFFGHQLTIHQSSAQRPANKIDHFGPILNKVNWDDIVENLRKKNLSFIMEPTIKNKGKTNDSGKFLINDPAGNLLEFKYYLNFSESVGS